MKGAIEINLPCLQHRMCLLEYSIWMLLDDDQMTEQERRSRVILNLIQSLLGYFQPLKWLKSSAEAELQDFSAV